MYVRKLTRADVSMAAFTSEFNVSNVCSVRANYSSHAYLSQEGWLHEDLSVEHRPSEIWAEIG